MGKPPTFSKKSIKSAFRLVKRGRSWEFAAKKIGITREGLRKRCRSMGFIYTSKGMPIYRLPKLNMPTSVRDLSYLAAMIDAEGFIGRLNIHTSKAPYWAIGISNTDKRLIEWLLKIGGGAGFQKRKGSWKRKWDWWVRARCEVFIFLVKIEPFLRLKKHKAEKALADLTKFFCMHFKVKKRSEVEKRLKQLLAYEQKA